MPINPHPAIIFDFGKVLLDWDPRYLYRKLLPDDTAVENFLSEIHFYEWNVAHDAGQPFDESVAQLCEQFPHYCELIAAYHTRYPESIAGANQPVVEILAALKQASYPLYGLSNWPAGKFDLVRPQYPFFEWFDDIVLSGEVLIVKPDPRIYQIMLERIGRPAGECIFIDDSLANVAGAQRAGIQIIHYRDPEQLAAELADRLALPRSFFRSAIGSPQA